jgi:hypothetical protein
MKIIIKQNIQSAEHTIDTKGCVLPYAFKESFRLAMELDGVAKNTIDKVLGESEDTVCAPENSCKAFDSTT